MTHINEYGGAKYPKKRRIKRGDETNPTFSHRCRDCGKLRYVTRRELTRAAKPRCYACGGTLIETETAHKQIVAKQTSAALALGKSQYQPLDAQYVAKIACPYCYVGFTDTRVGVRTSAQEHLDAHLRHNPTCSKKHTAIVLVANAPPEWIKEGICYRLKEGKGRDRFLIMDKPSGVLLYDYKSLPRPESMSSLERAQIIAEQRMA